MITAATSTSPDTHSLIGRRVAIVGTMGSGKTTLARSLASAGSLPHIELDDFYWGPNWTLCPTDRFRKLTSAALAGDCWVVDGNHAEVRDIVWGRADTLIWLDYAVPIILSRLARRTGRRVLAHTELWHGNRERIGNVLDRKTLFFWVFSHQRDKRREYPALLASDAYRHLRVIRLRTPRSARRLLRIHHADLTQ